MASPPAPSPGPFATLPPPAQWLLLIAFAAAFGVALEAIEFPAALLIGPMLVAIAAGTGGATIRVSRPLFGLGQAVVGCLVAASIEVEVFSSFASDWPIILVSVLSTLAASSFLGWSISRLRILPGSTAVWGSAPGGATAMVLMAEAFGADARLVAFMQYLRVVMVTLAAAFVARLWIDPSAMVVPEHAWFPPLDWPAFAATVLVAAVAGWIGKLLRLPSPYFLGAALIAMALHLGAGVPFQIPEWLKAASYIVVGCSIGLNFTRAVVWNALRVLPQVMLSILLLMGFCGAIAWLLSHELGIDPLTAYLATSPGGLDSVAIIATAASNVNLSLIMALQSARLIFVLLFGPALVRFVARGIKP
ncbi:AbrB family transcriptional regulator [Mesorhizobium sp. LHD-90]|uniref:AbrB family transcriptional regulator n=1 Tax=Mesorhizobium sp. LHD-90 TaxID=3071414 RepID=UPI0027DECE1D|nr:AbrB family transcriptional regulator [Mesorhizobium sp. LHD-90]MDQ6436792.1 AbrB family transcriptional regulator [Mesorhizobium sp. LHD-90]